MTTTGSRSKHARKFLCGLFAMLALASTLTAHSKLVSSTPAEGAVVTGPGVALSLTFSARVDARRSRVEVVASDKSVQSVPPQQTSPQVIGSQTQLKPGAYLLRWNVLSADGHVATGQLSFRVK